MFPFKTDPNRFCDDPDVVDMLRVKSGESPAFEKILERNFQKMFQFAYRYLNGQRELAEDVTQDVFIKLYEMAPRYEPKAKVSTLLFQMTRNACLNQLRQKTPVSLDAVVDVSDGKIQHDQSMLQDEQAQAVREAIDRLPENQRTAILLRQYENLSYEEIAASLGVSDKAVKSLLNRAKENLAIDLKKYIL